MEIAALDDTKSLDSDSQEVTAGPLEWLNPEKMLDRLGVETQEGKGDENE